MSNLDNYQTHQKTLEDQKKVKLGLYLRTEFVFSRHNIHNYVLISPRGVGKSVISVETLLILQNKYGVENVKGYYFRIKDTSCKMLLANHGDKAVDPYLINKYNLDISSKNNVIYNRGKKLFEVYPLVSAGGNKGVNLYDCNFLNNRPIDPKTGKPVKRFIVTILDEFLLTSDEKKSVGDPVAQYRSYMEQILRDQENLDYDAVYNFFLANNCSECAGFTGAMWNYIPNPGNTKITKLTRKHTIVWNLPITEAYKEKRKKSINADIMDFDNDPNYSLIERDLSLIKKKKTRIKRVTNLIKFDKNDKSKWFCLYDGKYIRKYRGEVVNKSIIIPMKMYLDEVYNVDLVNSIIARYNARNFFYADIMSMSLFGVQLKLIKNR